MNLVKLEMRKPFTKLYSYKKMQDSFLYCLPLLTAKKKDLNFKNLINPSEVSKNTCNNSNGMKYSFLVF